MNLIGASSVSDNVQEKVGRSALWGWVRVIAGVAILVVIGLRLGSGPFVEALRSVDSGAVLVAIALTAGTTWCCARRWCVLARRLDVAVPGWAAYRACHRAQFLNATLPGGVLGDVHRAVRHGQDSGAMARGVRSVLWDRVCGQLVLGGLVLVTIPLLPAPVRSVAWWLPAVVVAVVVVAYLVMPRRALRSWWLEVRQVPGARAVWPEVVLLSAAAVAGHVVVFVIAARAVGVVAPVHEVVALALLVLQASAVPLNVAGWGPREGAAAWIFGAAGLGADAGLAVAVAFGVLATAGTFPGALMLRGRRADASALIPTQARGGRTWANVPTPS